jgi:hypothetical protein
VIETGPALPAPGGHCGESADLLRDIARRVAPLAIVLGCLLTPLWLGFLAWIALKGLAWLLG